jgi:hypothetical protein
METNASLSAAQAWAASEHGMQDAVVVDTARATDPASGRRLQRLRLASASDPNGASVAVVLGEDGRVLEDGAAHALLFAGAAPHVLAMPMPVDAPPITISPATNDLVLHEGETLDETLTVTVPALPRTPIDVYFVIDSTGSMGDIIAAVQAAAVDIVATLAALHMDIAYGVGDYKDFPFDAYAFRNVVAPTTSTVAVVTGLNSLGASGGADVPEGAFFALDQLAQPAGGSIGWRAGAQRILVWIGDAPAHDPICQALSGLGYAITEASVTAKLVAEHIQVLAISTATPGLDDDPVPGSGNYGACGAPGGSPGQGSRIAAATGGAAATGVDPTTIAATIISMISAALGTIGTLSLSPSASLAPFIKLLTPDSYGPINRDVEHTFPFHVRFEGIPCRNEAQVFTGTIDVLVDGKPVTAKRVRITVPPCDYIYSVKFVCGSQPAKDCHCTTVRPGHYATEINIHNPYHASHTIIKRFIPLVLGGAPVGREPMVSMPVRTEHRLVLPSHGASMDDCCSINEALYGAPGGSDALTVGIMEIIAPADLAVTAVYTAGCGDSVSIEVVPVAFRRG